MANNYAFQRKYPVKLNSSMVWLALLIRISYWGRKDSRVQDRKKVLGFAPNVPKIEDIMVDIQLNQKIKELRKNRLSRRICNDCNIVGPEVVRRDIIYDLVVMMVRNSWEQ